MARVMNVAYEEVCRVFAHGPHPLVFLWVKILGKNIPYPASSRTPLRQTSTTNPARITRASKQWNLDLKNLLPELASIKSMILRGIQKTLPGAKGPDTR